MDAESCVRSIALVLSAAIAVTNPAGARGAATGRQLVVGPNVLVSGANRDLPHMEVVACADRAQPSAILVASMASRRGRWITFLYRSTDGGRTWRQAFETSGLGSFGDPTCAFDAGGRAYYGVLTDRNALSGIPGGHRRETLIYSSPDGGRTWPGEPARLFGNIDRPFLTTDSSPERARHYVYLGALHASESLTGPDPARIGPDDPNVETGIAFFVSEDNGKTFGLAASPRQGRQDWVYGIGNSVVTASGYVVAPFRVLKNRLTRPYLERRDDESTLSVLRTGPGGEPTDPAISVADVRGGGFMGLAVDTTGRGPFSNRLYAVALHGGAVVLFWSADEGRTWHGPTLVRKAEASTASSAQPAVFNFSADVNRDGVVAVGWAEGTGNKDAAYVRSWTYRMAASWDGGETFSGSVTVSSDRHDQFRPATLPVRAATSRDGANRQRGSVMADVFPDSGGHTFGLTSDTDGVFHPAWTDNRTGVSQIWTAAVQARGEVVRSTTRINPDIQPASTDAPRDITSETAVEIGDITLSTTRRQITMGLRVRNGSALTLLPPLRVEIAEARSKLGDVKPASRSLDLSRVTPRAGLRRGEATGEQSIVFELPGDGELQVDRGAGEILTMVFRVEGRLR